MRVELSRSSWVRISCPRPAARVRLICLPFAGGSARCPVSAFGGLHDKEVTQDEIEAWSRHTVGPFQVHMLPGDHSFVSSCRLPLLRLITEQLTMQFID